MNLGLEGLKTQPRCCGRPVVVENDLLVHWLELLIAALRNLCVKLDAFAPMRQGRPCACTRRSCSSCRKRDAAQTGPCAVVPNRTVCRRARLHRGGAARRAGTRAAPLHRIKKADGCSVRRRPARRYQLNECSCAAHARRFGQLYGSRSAAVRRRTSLLLDDRPTLRHGGGCRSTFPRPTARRFRTARASCDRSKAYEPRRQNRTG